jgi:catechol 2,3-dioxygenase-like lactoylglutathione lyase family enzyme
VAELPELPDVPDPLRREHLLGVLAELIACGGADPLLAPPVVPGADAFPEPWRPTRAGTTVLLRRLAWHAGQHRAIVVRDERRGALATERKPETHVELTEVRAHELALTLSFLGEDDVAGTLAHEIGVAHAVIALSAPREPYRAPDQPVLAVDPDRDLERGSIATVYLGLGVLAANAAYQQYSRPGKFVGGHISLEYDVLRAGYVAMSDLAYLIAVQMVVRGATTLPRGLSPPPRDEATAWLAVLRDHRAELCVRLGIALDAAAIAERPAVQPFDDLDGDAADSPEPETAGRRAFRWQMHRGFFGFGVGFAGAVGAAIAIAAVMPIAGPVAACLIGGPIVGHLLGRQVRIARCSAVGPPRGRGAPRRTRRRRIASRPMTTPHTTSLGNFSVSLAVKDLAASRAFYQKLGFTIFTGDPEQKHFLILQNGGATIGLFQGMFERNLLTFNPGWDSTASTLNDFTDVRALQRQLRSVGIEPATAADESTTGPASFMIIDPDGNPILFDQHV